jgi:nucleotide-binding universal stress UspA family protein
MATRGSGDLPRQVVVGTDGSPTAVMAVTKAADLAAALGADLTVVCAYRQDTRGGGVWAGAAAVDPSWVAAESAAAEKAAQAAAEMASGRGVKKVTPVVASGDPADVLVGEAEKRGADLLVVGSRGMRSKARFLLGSVPNEVSHRTPCDVLIVDTRSAG